MTTCMERLVKLRPHRRHRRRHLGPDSLQAKRMRTALEMHDLGVRMYAQQMRRKHPLATEEEIDVMVRAWLIDSPRQRENREEGQRDDSGRET